MRKKTLATILCFSIILGVCGCGNTTNTEKQTNTTTEPKIEEAIESADNEGKVLKQLTVYESGSSKIYEYNNQGITVTNKNLMRYTAYDVFGNIFESAFGYKQVGLLSGTAVCLDAAGLGSVSKYSYYSGDTLVGYYEYSCDDNGNLLTEMDYGTVGLESSVRYEYDSNGNLSKETWYKGSEEQIYRWYTYGYDEEGNLLEITFYNTDTTYTYIKYEYNASGNIIKESIHHGSLIGDDWREYEYDNTGNLIKVTMYDEDGTVDYSIEYKYDELGNILEIENTHNEYDDEFDYSYVDVYLFQFEYDEQGNCLSIISYENSEWSGEYDYEYDSNGVLIKCTYEWEGDGDISVQEYIFEYYE